MDKLTRLPLVGRAAELAELRAALERARAGQPSVVVLTGEGGVGKSRLTELVADDARHDGWTVAVGRAYAVESGVPYAVFGDALVPLLRERGASGLTLLARGAEAHLAHLFPALRSLAPSMSAGGDGPANRAELFWTFSELLKTLSSRSPLLVVLDDLHWADPSSVELFHFLSRQLATERIVVIATVNDAERDAHPTLRATLKSLESLGVVRQRAVEALSRDGTAELVRHAFGVDEAVTREFTALLYGWTRGNPFFIQATLEALVDSGRLRTDEKHGWRGWEVDELDLPRSVRDAVELRLDRLEPAARDVAEIVAVVGTRVSYSTIRAVADLPDAALVAALERLRLYDVLSEEGVGRDPVYDFRHPMLRQAVHARAGLARRRILHARIAETLEAQYGDRAMEHADELAHHFMAGESGEPSPRAAKYLAAAGRSALKRHAGREAAAYLEEALRRSGADDAQRVELVRDLARARQRLGEFDRAVELHRQVLDAARADADHDSAALTLRRIGLAHFRAGAHDEALRAYDEALAEAALARDPAMAAQIRVARGSMLQGLGRVAESIDDLRAALDVAERAGERPLQARVHRELLLFHTMAGPPHEARHHGERAIAIARETGDRVIESTCHWAMAVLAGLTGRADECAGHMQRATELAEELNSPLLRLAIDEIHVEWAYGLGAWDTGLALGERAIALARSLHQRSVLTRLLVWTGILYLGRYEIERARLYIDEAWRLSGAGDPTRVHDVNTVVPAYIGRAQYHMTLWEWDEAIRLGQEALDIVDATGYRTWAVHRLLPIIAEAQLSKFDADSARVTGARLRRDAEALDHPLGRAWADASDAILTFVEGDPAAAVPRMRAAIERLEAVPYVPYATRLRRHLAGRLAQIGDRDAAISELRHAHDIFVRLGAEWEIERARGQFQEVGARPPGRIAGQGADALTERELDIIRLVVAGKSNKAIGKALEISPRTVGTHLSNIYSKLEIGSRDELADMAPRILGGNA